MAPSVNAMVDRSLSGLNSFISEQRILNGKFTATSEAQDALRGEVDDLSSGLSDAVAKLEGIDEMLHQQFGDMSNKLQESVAMLTSEQNVLAEGHASLVSQLDELQRQHDNLNQVSAEKASALEGLTDAVDKLASELEGQSVSHANAIENLGHVSNREYCQLNVVNGKLQEMMAQIVSDQKNLTAKDVELSNYLAELSNEKKVSDQSFTARLEALENLELRFDELLDKFKQQLAVDETAAATFHTMAVDKYKLLETTCDELETLLDMLSSDQKQLVEKTAKLVSEQDGLQNRVAQVEEQSESSCHELRVTMVKKEKEWEQWKRSSNTLVNSQRDLWCKLNAMEKELKEQKSAISEIPKVREQNLIRTIALSLRLGLDPEDLTDDGAVISNEIAEKPLESVPKVDLRRAYYTIATFVFLTNFLCFPLLAYIFREVFDYPSML